MNNQLKTADVVSMFRSDQSLVELPRLLRADYASARAILEDLSRHGDPEIRQWVAGNAAQVLGSDSRGLLVRLTRDMDVDVRIDAIGELARVDPGSASRLKDVLRESLSSDDMYEVQAAVWALGAIGAIEELDGIRRVQAAPGAIPRNAAITVELVLTNPDELLSRIERHDHDFMPWLVRGAAMLGTPDAIATLERCMLQAPDAECRGWAEDELSRLRELP